MIEFIILPIAGALSVAIKGGWVGKFWRKCPNWFDNHVPPVLMVVACLFFFPWYIAVLCGLSTYIFKLSMGEEAGAIINNTRNEYIDTLELGREFGIKKAVQRGVMDGAAFSLATWNPLMIFAGLFFVPTYWAMSKLKYKLTNVNDWAWAEPVYGVIFGLFLAITV